jgi:hypothetical protein
MGLKWPLNVVDFSDIQYFAVSTSVYVLSKGHFKPIFDDLVILIKNCSFLPVNPW